MMFIESKLRKSCNGCGWAANALKVLGGGLAPDLPSMSPLAML